MASPALKTIPLELLQASLQRQNANLATLEMLATFGNLTTKQIARYRYGTPTKTQEQNAAKILKNLRQNKGLVITRPTSKEIAANRMCGFWSPVSGLTEK